MLRSCLDPRQTNLTLRQSIASFSDILELKKVTSVALPLLVVTWCVLTLLLTSLCRTFLVPHPQWIPVIISIPVFHPYLVQSEKPWWVYVRRRKLANAPLPASPSSVLSSDSLPSSTSGSVHPFLLTIVFATIDVKRVNTLVFRTALLSLSHMIICLLHYLYLSCLLLLPMSLSLYRKHCMFLHGGKLWLIR